MRRPSRENRKSADQDNQSQPSESIEITLGRDQIDENRLHPTPIPGINGLEPVIELVDPLDWFLQPVRGNNLEFGGIDFTVSEDGCITCVSVRGTVGWLTASEGNGAGFCYIKPSCRKKPPPPPPPVPPELPQDLPDPPRKSGTYQVTITRTKISETRQLCYKPPIVTKGNHPDNGWTYTRTVSLKGNENWGIISNDPYSVSETAYCDGIERGKTYYSSVNIAYGLVSPDNSRSVHLGSSLTAGGTTGGLQTNSYVGADYLALDKVVNFTPIALDDDDEDNDDNNDNGDESPPPKPPENDKMACCRNQSNSDALLRKIAKCVGTHQLPATMPESFNRSVNGTTRISSIPEFQQWLGVQLSDLIGEFPKKIKIKDANLLEDGDQGIEIELMNLSEAIADIYGTSIRGTAVNEVLMAFATRIAVEICSVKAATLVGQSYSKATALALGYKMEEEKELIPFGFNFTADATKLEDFLENTEKKITVWKCKEPSSAWEYFERLMYVAGLLKAKTLRKESSTIDDTINRIVDSGFLSGDKLDDFITKLKEAGFYNLDGTMRKPDLEEL